MSQKDELEVRLDQLEQVVLNNARLSRAASSPSVEEALVAARQRIAVLPLTGLPNIQIPPVPASPSPLHPFAPGTALPAASGGAQAALPSLPTTAWLSLTPLKVVTLGAGLLGAAAIAPSWIVPEEPSRDSASQVAEPNEAKNESLTHGGFTEARSSNAQARNSMPIPLPQPQEPRVNGRATPGNEPSSQRRSETESPHGGLGRELQGLHEAQRALQTGDAQGAWQRMISLDQTSPNGALRPEREMTKVLALCALGNESQAQALAGELRASSAGAVYGARLENSCARAPTPQEPVADPRTPAKN